MESLKLQNLGLQAWLGIAILTIILVAGPARSNVVPKDAVNKLCGDDRLYFNETRRCYQANKKGPCGELMVLEPTDADENIGKCNCGYIRGGLLCPDRPKVFWKAESRCYYIYDQGPCKKGEWVVPHKDDIPSCERITCPEKYNAQLQKENYDTGTSRFIAPREGDCYQVYTKGTHFCRPEEYVFFIGGDSFNLHCKESLACGFTSSEDTDCADGSAPDLQGGCEPITIL